MVASSLTVSLYKSLNSIPEEALEKAVVEEEAEVAILDLI